MSIENGKTGFLEEKPGVKSSMRLMSLLVFFLFVGVEYLSFVYLSVGYYKEHPLDMWIVVLMISLTLLFLVSIFYPKYLQKIIELGASKIGTFKDAIAPVKPENIQQGEQK